MQQAGGSTHIHIERYQQGVEMLFVSAKQKVPIILCSILILLSMFSYASAIEEGDKIYLGEARKIKSAILNEERTVLVYTPEGYDQSDDSYPVLYLLDGTQHFHHVTGIAQYLAARNLISPLIVVAIANTDRTRDFSPTVDSTSPATMASAGGADNFIAFIDQELKPFIDKNYRTADYRILVGHSFGGLFAVYTLFKYPELFDAVIAVSATYWWDNLLLQKMASKYLDEHDSFNKFLYMTMGTEGEQMTTSGQSFADMLSLKAPADFVWEYRTMPAENHGSIPHRSIYDGLEKLYQGWTVPVDLLAGNYFDVENHYKELSRKFGYDIPIPENIINQMGYLALGANRDEKAIALFRKNIELHPNSANVYDSMGEGYEAMGDYHNAAKFYRTAVEKGEANNDPLIHIFRQHLENASLKVSN